MNDVYAVLGIAAMVVDEGFGGSCPVQASGTISDRAWYFRARGQHWSVAIGEDGGGGYVSHVDADLFVCGPSDDVRPYSAGYMEDHESERHLRFAMHLYARGIRGVVEIPDPADLLPPCMKCATPTAGRWRMIAMCPGCAPELLTGLISVPS